jgi:hypothetical protein
MFLGVVLMLAAEAVWAQQTRGVILGRITDQSSAVVPGARVTLLNEKIGISSAASIGAQGEYTLTNVEPGAYRVTVAGKGFKTSAVQNITVFVTQTASRNVQFGLRLQF